MNGKKLKTVCVFDPGHPYVNDGEKLFAWARSRDYAEIEQLFDKANMPTVYTYRRLPQSVMDRYVDNHTNDDLRAIAAFRYGVVAIDNLRQTDGAVISSWTPSGNTHTPAGQVPTLTQEEMDMPELSRAEKIEIGSVIYNTSFLPQWAERSYPVSPLSLNLWARLEYQSVDASQSTAAQNSARPLEQGSQQMEQTGPGKGSDESKSEPVTDVTVVAKTG